MKYGRLGALAVGAVALAASAGLLVGGSGAAVAAGGGGPNPPWLSTETVAPLGSIIFYNAQGQVITGGNINDTQMAAYAVASAPAPAPGPGFSPYTAGTLYENTPVANANPLTWTGGELSLRSTFPHTSAPGGIGTTSNPVVANAADVSLNNVISAFPNTQTAAGWGGLYDIRMLLSGIGSQPTNAYYETVVSVTGNTWSVDYPDFTQNTTTTLTANPPSPQTPPASPVTLTATVAPATAGTVSFYSGSTQVGTTQAVTATNGVATVMTTPPTGTTKYQAFFTPAIPDAPPGTGNTEASFDTGSASSTLSYVVAQPTTSTTTTLTATPPSPVSQGSTVNLTATEVASDTTHPAGSVQFFQGTAKLGTAQTVNSSGVATLATSALKPTAPAGSPVTATFTPSATGYASSTSTALTYQVNPVAVKPTLSGPHQVGQKETCSEGTLDSGVTATYAWLVGTTQVGTGTSLTVPASAYNKELTCKVTVQDGTGPTSSATSNPVKVSLGKALTATKKPSLSGLHKVGKTETVKPGTWSQKATFTYQWLLNGKVIRHATKSTFKPTSADRGKKLSCRVTAHAAGYANGVATTSSVKIS